MAQDPKVPTTIDEALNHIKRRTDNAKLQKAQDSKSAADADEKHRKWMARREEAIANGVRDHLLPLLRTACNDARLTNARLDSDDKLVTVDIRRLGIPKTKNVVTLRHIATLSFEHFEDSSRRNVLAYFVDENANKMFASAVAVQYSNAEPMYFYYDERAPERIDWRDLGGEVAVHLYWLNEHGHEPYDALKR